MLKHSRETKILVLALLTTLAMASVDVPYLLHMFTERSLPFATLEYPQTLAAVRNVPQKVHCLGTNLPPLFQAIQSVYYELIPQRST